jgi:hypothetical protein
MHYLVIGLLSHKPENKAVASDFILKSGTAGAFTKKEGWYERNSQAI